MKIEIRLPEKIKNALYEHLFQNDVEQAGFLFARCFESSESIVFEVFDQYLVPEEGWAHQSAYHLELDDAERARIMKLASDQKAAIIDCHSHVGVCSDLNFSLSDVTGIKEFKNYVKWKLDGKPYGAMVLNSSAIDAVAWHGNFEVPCRIDKIQITGKTPKTIVPLMTWNDEPWKKKGAPHVGK